MCVPVLSLAIFAASTAAQPAIPRPDGGKLTPAQIDSTVNSLIQAAHVTGAGVALFHRGEIVYLKAYGLRDTEKGLPLTPDSVMTAAWLNKSAFATVVMRLVQRGTLDLDKPIEEYLGKPLSDFVGYADLAGDPRTARLTLRVLLDHTTGFANSAASKTTTSCIFTSIRARTTATPAKVSTSRSLSSRRRPADRPRR